VNFATGGRFVSAYGKQREVDTEAVANFLEAREVSCVATMKNRAAIRRDYEPTEITVQIRKKSGSPVVTGRERNLERPEFDGLPVVEFMHDVKPEIVNQISDSSWNNDWLIRSYAPQRAPVQVIEMRMCDKYEINGRQMLNFEARSFQSFNDLEPFRPNRVDQDVDLVRLNEK